MTCWSRSPPAEEAGRWRELRRGWYLGSESFGDRLMDWAAGAVAGRQRASYSGESLRGHDQREAERLLGHGLERLKGKGKGSATNGIKLRTVWDGRAGHLL